MISQSPFDCARADLEQYKCLRCSSFRTHLLHHLKRHFKEHHTKQIEEFRLHRCKNCTFETWSKYLIIRHKILKICVSDKRKLESGAEILPIEHDHCYYTKETQFDNIAGKLESVEHDHYYYKKDTQVDDIDHSVEKFSSGYSFIESSNSDRNSQNVSANELKQRESVKCLYKSKDRSNLKGYKLYKHPSKDDVYTIKSKYDSKSSHYRIYNHLSQNNLVEHSLQKHGPKNSTKWFECDQCGYKTQHEAVLGHHIFYRHPSKNGAKWFECDQCSYKSKHISDLKEHRLEHFPESKKWLYCDHCSFKSMYIGSLKTHKMFIHRPEVAMKQFVYDHLYNRI